jgi:hypothetical protein
MRIDRTTRRFLAAAVLAAVAFSVPVTAEAQSSAPPLTVDEIRYCLCQQRRIEAVRPELDMLRAMVSERQSLLMQREAEIEEMRRYVSSYDIQGQDQIKRNIYEANMIRDVLRRDLMPNYLGVTQGFNELVSGYNQYCSNRRMIARDITAAETNLQCAEDAPASFY